MITLTREYDPEVTEGILTDDAGKKICYTLELPWKNNESRISCIPEGKYKFQKKFSSHLGWVYELKEVSDRSLIYMHSGNTILDILGCILVGTKRGTMTVKGKVYPAVLNSRDALANLMTLVGNEGIIIIKGA